MQNYLWGATRVNNEADLQKKNKNFTENTNTFLYAHKMCSFKTL